MVTTEIIRDKKAMEELEILAKFPNKNPNPVMRVAKNGLLFYANQASLPLLRVWQTKTGQPVPAYHRKQVIDILENRTSKNIEVELNKHIIQ